MTRRRAARLTLALGALLLSGVPTVARADDAAACIASSERELGLRKQLKLRDALKELSVCAAPACPTEVRAECNRRLNALNDALPTIVLGVSDAAGNDIVAVKVSLDGALLTSAVDGRAIVVDPGSHTLQFEAPGFAPLEKTVVIGEGVKDRHVAVVLAGPLGSAATTAPVPVVTPPRETTPVAPPSPQTEEGRGGGARTAGYVIGGVGVAGLAVGAIVGGLAIAKVNKAKGECLPSCDANTNSAAYNDMHTASTYAPVSTAAFIAGGTLLAAGVVMVIVGGPKSTTTGFRWSPTVLPNGGGLALAGGW